MLAAMSVPRPLPHSSSPQAPAFSNLVDFLFESPEQAGDDIHHSSQDSSAADASPSADAPAEPFPAPAPSAQVADAMIRSMLSSASNVASATATRQSTSFVKKTPSHAAQPGNSQPADVVAPAFTALAPLPVLQSAATAGAAAQFTKAAALKLPVGATVIPAAAKRVSPAPLAFGMKVTPVAEPITPAELTPSGEPILAAEQVRATESAQVSEAAQTAFSPVQSAAVSQPVYASTESATVGDEAEPQSKPAAESKPAAAQSADGKRDQAPAQEETLAITAAAATTGGANDGSNDFGRQMPAAMANPSAIAGVGKPFGSEALASSPGSSSSSAMEALRASEPSAPAPAQATAPVKEITVRMTAPQAPAVDVHLAERAGQLHVAVRTADGGLQTSLRQDLGSLVNSLERAGYRAQAFTPREGAPAASASAPMNFQNGRQESGSGSGNRNGNSGDTSQDSTGGQRQQRRDPRQPKWIEELENQS